MRHKKPKMRIHIIILHLFSFYFFCFSIIKQFFRFNFSTSQPSAKFVRCLWDAGYEWWMDNAVVLWGFFRIQCEWNEWYTVSCNKSHMPHSLLSLLLGLRVCGSSPTHWYYRFIPTAVRHYTLRDSNTTAIWNLWITAPFCFILLSSVVFNFKGCSASLSSLHRVNSIEMWRG